jgi:hypothetical protein
MQVDVNGAPGLRTIYMNMQICGALPERRTAKMGTHLFLGKWGRIYFSLVG